MPSITTNPEAGGWEPFSPQLDFLLTRPSFLIRPQSAYEIFYILQSREAWSNGMCPRWRSLYCKPCPTRISPLSNSNTLAPSWEVTILLIHGDTAYSYDWMDWLPSRFSLTEESPQLWKRDASESTAYESLKVSRSRKVLTLIEHKLWKYVFLSLPPSINHIWINARLTFCFM